MCPAVLVKTRVCEGCLVSRAHKTSLRSILFCIYQYQVRSISGVGLRKKRSSFGEEEEKRGGKCAPSIPSLPLLLFFYDSFITTCEQILVLAHPFPSPKKRLHCNLSLNEFRIFYQNHLNVSFTALKLFDNFFNFDRAQAQCLHSFY